MGKKTPVLDETLMLPYIMQKTGYSRRLVQRVLTAEMDYLVATGIAVVLNGELSEIADCVYYPAKGEKGE